MFNVLKILKENLNTMKNETVKTKVMKNEANLSQSQTDQRRLGDMVTQCHELSWMGAWNGKGTLLRKLVRPEPCPWFTGIYRH